MSLSQVEDGPTVNCLRCGISVAMTSMGKHIADVHENDCEAPHAKVTGFAPHEVQTICFLAIWLVGRMDQIL